MARRAVRSATAEYYLRLFASKKGSQIMTITIARAPLLFAILTTSALFISIAAGEAAARTFGGNECTDDCSGHKAGYEWAESRGIADQRRCEKVLIQSPNSTSFAEGCSTYIEDPSRGSDEDDDGEAID